MLRRPGGRSRRSRRGVEPFIDEYERLKQDEYDDSPSTREELQSLAWERLKHEDWDEYDDLPEKP